MALSPLTTWSTAVKEGHPKAFFTISLVIFITVYIHTNCNSKNFKSISGTFENSEKIFNFHPT